MTLKHNIACSEFSKHHPWALTICSESRRCYAPVSNIRTTTNYRNKLKASGNDATLRGYNQRVGEEVSKTILNMHGERKRRANLLACLNKTPAFIQKASDTAKLTSARPEIIEARTQRLISFSGSRCWQSKPEQILFDFCFSIDPTFERQKRLYRTTWGNFSHTHQIDIYSSSSMIVVEFDGPLHFKPIYGESVYIKAQTTDAEVNTLAAENFTVIRVGNDQYNYASNKRYFHLSALQLVSDLIRRKSPGLFLIGESYGTNNILPSYWEPSDLRPRSGAL